VALEATFHDLVARLRGLRDLMAGLQITVIEDRPLSGAVLLVERLGNSVDDLRGLVEETLASAIEALDAVGNPLDGYRARNALATANRRFLRLEYKFLVEQMSSDHLSELKKLGRDPGGEWKGWIRTVLQALTQCREPIREVDDAFLSSWQDLSERLGNGGVSVQTTNIGAISASATARRKQSGTPEGAEIRDRKWT
jgi:hypothetical protein